MDMSFANQALSIAYLWEQGAGLENSVHPVPVDIDHQVAVMKLAAMRLRIDSLSPEQQAYLSSWKEGT
jgi:adenosylhomocysteinase